jgi:hypothetical protein
MARKISVRTRQLTKRCPRSFGCLDDETIEMCTIENCIEGNGCFLKTLKFEGCTYQMSFGYSKVCNCPTRFELYKKYGI